MDVKPVKTCLDLLTPGYEYRGGVKKCQWCHGTFADGQHKNELIKRSKDESTSVGMMCDDCYNYLIVGPEIDFIGHAIYARHVHEHIRDYDDRHVPSYDPKKSLKELAQS
jgi:hypothetical protein